VQTDSTDVGGLDRLEMARIGRNSPFNRRPPKALDVRRFGQSRAREYIDSRSLEHRCELGRIRPDDDGPKGVKRIGTRTRTERVTTVREDEATARIQVDDGCGDRWVIG